MYALAMSAHIRVLATGIPMPTSKRHCWRPNKKGNPMSKNMIMPGSIDAFRALVASKVANAPKPSGKGAAKTLKGQRSQAKAVAKASKEVLHTCVQPDFDELEQVCEACASWGASAYASQSSGWSTPAPLYTWSSHNYGVSFATRESALDAGRADIVIAYNRYVHDTFSTPVTFGESGSFEKIVARQYRRELQGFANLGLLGYSAIDIVDLAVYYAWVDVVTHWLAQTGCDQDVVTTISQALRDLRSDAELREVAQLGVAHRYIYGTDGRLRKQDQLLAVRNARKFLAARRLVRLYPVWEYAADFVPSAGAVYRKVGLVFREGMRQFNNTKEGLTPDGVITDGIQFVAIHVGDVVKSAESEYFDVVEYDESVLARETLLSEYFAKPSLTQVEADALTVAYLLMQKQSLWEIRTQFESEKQFRRAVADAQQLFAA